MDSNIDTDENMDIITKSGNPIVEIRKIEIRKNERQTSQDNSNELNLEEIETDSAKKGKMLSGGGGKNKNLRGKKVSRKHAILKNSMKGKKRRKKVSDFKDIKSNRHHLDSVINSGAFPRELINQVAIVLKTQN